MSRIFITGSGDGLGRLSARLLIEQGHSVVLHARNKDRAKEALRATPGAEKVLVADLSNLEETKDLALQANESGLFDAIIHNAGVYNTSARQIFAVNTLAPYVLTCLIQKPRRLVYLSSGMHLHGHLNLEHLRNKIDAISYSDSKLHVMMLTLVVAHQWRDVFSNAVDPGWVPTKMGGANAPDDLQKGFETQAWLAVSEDNHAKVSGHYFFHMKVRSHHPLADDLKAQQNLILSLEEITGVTLRTKTQ